MKKRFVVNNDYFHNIPGSPIAYWISKKFCAVFSSDQLNSIATTKQGFATGDNNRFLRMWFEVEMPKLRFGVTDIDASKKSGGKWFPCNKGGGYRKWYGNNYYVVNWENDGKEMREFEKSVIRNPNYYFRKGITWSSLSNNLSLRYSDTGFLFESKGSMCFMNNDDLTLLEVLGLLNSKVVTEVMSIFSPTLDFHEGPMSKVPIMLPKDDNVKDIIEENIKIAKEDWNSFEESWDYRKHPLI